jgi:two-component system, NtrC family, sensor kinase
VTLRSRLTLLFLAAVEVTFLSAVAAYWGLQSWRLATEELTVIHEQHRRLVDVLDRLAADPAMVERDRSVAAALDGLRRNVQTVDESERIDALATAVVAGAPGRARHAVTRLTRYYEHEHRRLRDRGVFLARVSNALLVGIVGLVIASFGGFLAAIRSWFVEPVRTLEHATEIISTGDLAHRIPLEGDDELGRLAASINRMAVSLAHIQTQLVTSERFALLGELAAYVAHNIRNPLASIRATAQAEALELPADDPTRTALADIVRAVDRLSAWVTDLLRSVSPVALERRPGSVSELVARCVELARPRIHAAGIDVEIAAPPTPVVSFDEAKLEQVVSAVLANATDASPPGGRIGVRVEHDGSTIALRIADEGAGVPPNRRGTLFTPFRTSKAAGTGLGLWLSQKIVVAHGGTITLRDGQGCGTTVEIRLPVAAEGRWPAS